MTNKRKHRETPLLGVEPEPAEPGPAADPPAPEAEAAEPAPAADVPGPEPESAESGLADVDAAMKEAAESARNAPPPDVPSSAREFVSDAAARLAGEKWARTGQTVETVETSPGLWRWWLNASGEKTGGR